MSTASATPAAPPDVDLSVCDREPIHIPGSIQPHGFLIAVHEASGRISHVSENVRELLDLDWRFVLGKTVGEIFGANTAALLRKAAEAPLFSQRAVFIDRLSHAAATATRTFALVGHRRDGWIILEGEEQPADGPWRDTRYQLETFLSRMEESSGVRELLELAVVETRRITGFDRVMVYQFDPDWNGIVIAEDRNERLPSYLDLRFPDTDIPRQARELYRINRLRLIAASRYEPVKLVAANADNPPLDLSLATLRSVSPVHLEYMQNMGTGSSMSISLLRGGTLWGLISCHSRDPHIVPFELRSTCDLLGQMLSLQLGAREQAMSLRYRMDLRSLLTPLMTAMARKDNFAAGLMAESRLLLKLTAATGVGSPGTELEFAL